MQQVEWTYEEVVSMHFVFPTSVRVRVQAPLCDFVVLIVETVAQVFQDDDLRHCETDEDLHEFDCA